MTDQAIENLLALFQKPGLSFSSDTPTDKVLILTVGLPRAGKSWWAKRTGLPMVNPDSIRLSLHGSAFAREAEPMVWLMAKYFVKSLFTAGHNIVILDSCSYGKKFRDDWFYPSQWRSAYKVFDTPKEICIARAQLTNPDLIPVIEKQAERFEPLSNFEKSSDLDVLGITL